MQPVELGLSWELGESDRASEHGELSRRRPSLSAADGREHRAEHEHGDLSVRLASLGLADSLSHFMQDWQRAAERRIDTRENVSNEALLEAVEGARSFEVTFSSMILSSMYCNVVLTATHAPSPLSLLLPFSFPRPSQEVWKDVCVLHLKQARSRIARTRLTGRRLWSPAGMVLLA